MLEVVTGLSLAAAAGLNAYIPLLGIGLLARFTPVIDLPDAWSWIENEWVLAILGVLLIVELVVDKIPALDSVNDILQTIIRPTSGGLVFSAGSASDTVAVTDPEAFVNSPAFWPFVIGVIVALIPHVFKLVVRPLVNLATGGAGATVMSVLEDGAAVLVTILAVIVPLIALAVIAGCIVLMVRAVRRMRRRRATRGAQQPIAES